MLLFMARHVFYTQIKSSLLYSERLMDWIIAASFIWAATVLFVYHTDTFVFIPFFALVLYNIFLYKPTIREWDMGGFQKMVIDTNSGYIIFDDRVKLKIDNIERVRIEVDERPRLFWLLGLGAQYTSIVNCEVIFRLDTKTNTVVPMQFRKDIFRLIEVIGGLGKPCRIQNEELLNEGVPDYIWYLLVFVIVLIAIGTVIVNFFRNLVTM